MKYRLESLELIEGTPASNYSHEAQEIINQIRETAFSLREEAEVRLFIQNHQIALLKLRKEESKRNSCDEILHFLESYFLQFLDHSMPVSRPSRQMLYKDYNGEIIKILNAIFEFLPVDFLIVIYPVFQLLGHDGRTINRFIYQTKLIPEFIKYYNVNTLNKQVIFDFLIRFNYNHLPFVNYLINDIVKKTNEEDYTETHLEVLLRFHKRYSQLAMYHSYVFEPDLPSIKAQLIAWLNEEIKHCKRLLRDSNSTQTRLEFKKTVKLQTPLTVQQLACMIRAFQEAGIITNAVEKDVFKVVANSFETPKSKNISLESIYNKRFEVDNTIISEVRKALNDSIKKLAGF